MHCFPTRLTRTLAAAAFLTLPLAAAAQTPDTKIDAGASKIHLSEARDTLSQLTSLPEAARLQGDARTQVTQIISSFNELITTQSDWRSAYGKVNGAVTALLGSETQNEPPAPMTGVTGAVGTSGSAAAAGLDPAVRAKLVEFRTHLKEFERAAGGATSAAMAPGLAPGTTANPANPATAISPANPPASAAADQPHSADAAAGRAEVDKHLEAISAILNQSKTGTLMKAQTAALKKHVAELRILLNQSR